MAIRVDSKGIDLVSQKKLAPMEPIYIFFKNYLSYLTKANFFDAV